MPTEQQYTKTEQPRALSMWQPWASFLAHGIKTIETRGRDTPFRGEFYIHATGNIPKQESYIDHYLADPEFLAIVNRFLGLNHFNPIPWSDYREAFPTGQLIGRANLVMTMPTAGLHGVISDDDRTREQTLGEFGPERWAWICEAHSVLSIGKAPLPPMGIPAKGSQSILWKFDSEILRRPIHYMRWDGDFYQI